MKPRGKKLIWMIPIGILAIALFAFIGGEIVMRLWNWLLPSIFGWRQITFWQALGILVLCRILFGGFHGHGAGRSHWRGRMRERMEARMIERWEKMTPEERASYSERIGRWCGPAKSEPKTEQ
jgi:hypothetical protein